MDSLLMSAIGFAVVATISPGGATTLATASGAKYGVRRSLDLRNRTIRLVQSGFALMRGGYLEPLVARARGATAFNDC